jgi:sugar lactone lactonase YvrE
MKLIFILLSYVQRCALALIGLVFCMLVAACGQKSHPNPTGVASPSLTPTLSRTVPPSQSNSPTITATLVPSPTSTWLPTETPTPIPTKTLTLTPIPTVISNLPTEIYGQGSYMPNYVRAMLIDRDGNLWTGGKGGVVRWDIKLDTHVTYTTRNGLVSYDILAMAQTPDSAIWIGTSGAGVFRFDGVSWQAYTTNDGLPGDYIDSLTVMAAGTLLALARPSQYWDIPSSIVSFSGKGWISTIGGGFDTIVAAADGTLWGDHFWGGLFHFDGIKTWESISNMQVTALAVAQDGTAWVGSTGNAYHVVSRTIYKLNPPWIGKTDASVSAIAVAPDGVIWFGFSYTPPYIIDRCGERSQYEDEFGVYRYDGMNWIHYTTKDGLVDNKICAIVTGSDGSVWFGTYDKGISRFDGHNWTTYTVP